MKYCIYRSEKEGYTRFVDHRQQVINKIRLGYIQLPAGGHYRMASGNGFEGFVVLLSGSFYISYEGKKREKIGPRADVFTEKAWGVYIPVNKQYVISTDTGCEACICRVKANKSYPFAVVRPQDVTRRSVGKSTFARDVFDIAGVEFPAQRIVLGETLNPAGHWSSFPPHKHDTNRGSQESMFEEVYYFRTRPESGFGFLRIYSYDKGVDEAFVIKHHSAVMIPFGYHPVSAPPGYQVYYLWILAGEERRVKPAEDPAHSWIVRE